MMKKKLALVLAAMMAASVVTSCSGGTDVETSTGSSKSDSSSSGSSMELDELEQTAEPGSDELAFRKFDEPVDVHIAMSVNPTDKTLPAGDDVENNQYTRYLKENYNINIIVDWSAASGNDFDQKVSLAIASDTLPDGLATSYLYKQRAAKSGMLKDITDIFNMYASKQVQGVMESTDGRAMEDASYDGKMVSLVGVEVETRGVSVLNIRKDWLDNLGLEVPKTLDDIETVARAFKEKMPDIIPIAGPDKNGVMYSTFLASGGPSYGFDPVFGAYDVYPGYWIENEDGSVEYGSTNEKMKDALTRLQNWYTEGLIDPEMGVRDTTDEIKNANQVAMYFGPWWINGYGSSDVWRNDPNANWQSYPVFSDDGKWNVSMPSATSSYTIVSKNASDEAAKAIVIMSNALLRDESTFDVSVELGWYPIRNLMAPADECEYEYDELLKILDGEAEPEDYADVHSSYKLMYKDAQIVRDMVPGYEKGKELSINDFNKENTGNLMRMHALLIGNRPYATTPVDKKVYSKTYNMTETMEKKWSNLEKLEKETMLKIVTGKQDVSTFDDFVKQWSSEGGEEIVKEVEALK